MTVQLVESCNSPSLSLFFSNFFSFCCSLSWNFQIRRHSLGVWTFPPRDISWLKFFCRGLKLVLEAAGERAEANDGYKGEPMAIELPQEGCFYPDAEEQRLIKSKVRSRHETVNGHFKNFGCLSQHYRHKLCKHKLCFGAVSAIVQIGIINKELNVFQVREYKTQTLYQTNF